MAKRKFVKGEFTPLRSADARDMVSGLVCGPFGIWSPKRGLWRVWHFPSSMQISWFDRTTEKESKELCLKMLDAFEWEGADLGEIALFNGMTEQQFADAVRDKLEGRT